MPKSSMTRVSSLSIEPSATNKNNGLFVPRLTTTQRNTIPAATLGNGCLIYNTTTATFEAYQAGAWTTITTAAAAALIAPAKANAGALPDPATRGMIVYQTDIEDFKISQNGAWGTVMASVTDATGVGLVAGNSPWTLPSGTRLAVEVAGNQHNGFIYNDTTNNVTRSYVNGAWVTVIASVTAATGVGLVAGNSPWTLPSGTLNAVEVAGNQQNGFIYNDTTNNVTRSYVNGAWVTPYNTTNTLGNLVVKVVANTGALPAAPTVGMIVYQTDLRCLRVYQDGQWANVNAATTVATGVGLSAGDAILSFPTGAANGVKVAGNHDAGFAFYNSTDNLLQYYDQVDSWKSIVSTTNNSGYASIPSGAVAPSANGAPTFSIPNAVGTLYVDTTGSKLYICTTAGTPGTWKGVAIA